MGMATPARFERATFPLGGGRSIQLSYGARLWIFARAIRGAVVRSPSMARRSRSREHPLDARKRSRNHQLSYGAAWLADFRMIAAFAPHTRFACQHAGSWFRRHGKGSLDGATNPVWRLPLGPRSRDAQSWIDPRTAGPWRSGDSDDPAGSRHAVAAVGTRRCLRVFSVPRHARAFQPLPGRVLPAHDGLDAVGAGGLPPRASDDRGAGGATASRLRDFGQPLWRVVARGAELLHPPLDPPGGAVLEWVYPTRRGMGPTPSVAWLHQHIDTGCRGKRRLVGLAGPRSGIRLG